MAATGVTTLPLGTEIIPQPAPPAPSAGGAAPWERGGASHKSPDDPESRAKAEQWKKRAEQEADQGPDQVESSERQRRAEERRARRKERHELREAQRVKALEQNARRLYLMGFFALPLLWLVSLLYFHKDYTSADPNPVIKNYYKKSRVMLILYTIIFVTWFVVFQVYSETALRSLNIIFFTGQSPSGF